MSAVGAHVKAWHRPAASFAWAQVTNQHNISTDAWLGLARELAWLWAAQHCRAGQMLIIKGLGPVPRAPLEQVLKSLPSGTLMQQVIEQLAASAQTTSN